MWHRIYHWRLILSPFGLRPEAIDRSLPSPSLHHFSDQFGYLNANTKTMRC